MLHNITIVDKTIYAAFNVCWQKKKCSAQWYSERNEVCRCMPMSHQNSSILHCRRQVYAARIIILILRGTDYGRPNGVRGGAAPPHYIVLMVQIWYTLARWL